MYSFDIFILFANHDQCSYFIAIKGAEIYVIMNPKHIKNSNKNIINENCIKFNIFY